MKSKSNPKSKTFTRNRSLVNYLLSFTTLLILFVSCQKKSDNPANNYLNNLDKNNTYIWIEAENPLEMADKSFVIVEDASSFGGKYITKPGGMLKLNFEIPASANYKILGRVFTKNGNADSWKFLLTNERGDTITSDVWNNINADKRNEWDWDEITTGRKTNDPWRPQLEKGKYTLAFIARDADDCMLDKILITNDTAFSANKSEKMSGMTYLHVEAESGEVEAPFKTGKSDESGKEYAWVEQAKAVYEFQITQPGKYKVWGYVRGESGNSDSVIGSIDDNPMGIWSFAKGGWKIWQWLPYNTKQDNAVQDFEEGLHKITFNQREKGAKVDALLVTNDLEYVPENKIQ